MAGETITLKLVAKDLASGNLSKAIGSIDKLAMRGGIAGSVFQGVGLSIGQTLNPIGLMARGIGALTDTIGDSVSAASDMEESQAKVEQVFTESADAIFAWSEDSARAFGLSQQAALEAAGTFGNFIQALGGSEDASNDMSQALVELSADLASFNNTGIDETLVALRSGLAGEAEPMRRLGIDVSAARVEMLLLANGVDKVNGKFTESQKVMGRYQAIMEDSVKAQGDFERTSDGLANSQRILAAEMDDAMAQLGEAILPVVTMFTQFAADVLPGVVKVIEELGDAFNDLNRLIDPNLALQQDLVKMVPKVAEAMGLEEEELQAAIKAQNDWQRAQDAAIQSREDALTAIEQEIIAAEALGGSNEDVAALIADATSATAEQAAMYLEADLTARQMAESLQALGVTTAEATEQVEKMTEAERIAREVGSSLLDARERQGRIMAVNTGQTAKVVKEANEDIAESFDVIPEAAGAAVRRTVATISQLGPGLKQTINAGKADVRKAMQNLRWAMEHPFAGNRYVKFLQRKQERANELLEKALADGKIEAAAEAKALVDAIQAELDRLDALSASVTVDMAVSRRDTPIEGTGATHPRRHTGGPVVAGSTYLVGERGPELLTMGSQSGHITPNGAAGGITLNVQALDVRDFMERGGPEIARWLRSQGLAA